MYKTNKNLLFVLLGVFLFDFCFWQEAMGINTLIFAVFYVGALIALFPDALRARAFQVTALGALLTAAMVAWHHSGAAHFAHFVSMACAAGFAQDTGLRYLWNALLQYTNGLFPAPRRFWESLSPANAGAGGGWSLRKVLGISIAPLSIVTVFYVLYYAANDNFARLADGFWSQLGRLFHIDISFTHLFFVLLALIVVGAAFWRNPTKLGAHEGALSDFLTRIRPPRKKAHLDKNPMLSLRREYQQSLLMLWLLNALLLAVNLTDLRFVWFGFDDEVQKDLKGYVHQGTYFLIVSILFAMGVLFYVFRKNLNFFPGNRILKTAAAIWLAQNAVLALSVGIRNARYIDFHGLAYKRIGVMLFLLMVFAGLVTLWQKIRDRRSMFWLMRANAWVLYGLILINACVNWDVFITRYNLFGPVKSAIDVQFLVFRVSDKNLHLLEENLDLLANKPAYPKVDAGYIKSGVEAKRRAYENRRYGLSWKSWNAADARNEKR